MVEWFGGGGGSGERLIKWIGKRSLYSGQGGGDGVAELLVRVIGKRKLSGVWAKGAWSVDRLIKRIGKRQLLGGRVRCLRWTRIDNIVGAMPKACKLCCG